MCSKGNMVKPGFLSPAEQQNHLRSPTPASQVRISRMETRCGYLTSWETLMAKRDALLNPKKLES